MQPNTHMQIEDSGRVFGYVTSWGRCLLDGSSDCWTPPKSPTQYALAHCGTTILDDGSEVNTANLGGGAGHAPGHNGATGAARYYQDTTTKLARVCYGEDENGIWFAGALWPDVTDVEIAEMRANGVSGDWRWIGDEGHYDFIGSCCVPVPGLPLYRAASAGDNPTIFGGSAQFSASGSTSIKPLNDRQRAWDSSAADKAIRKWASSDGSGDADKMDWAKYRSVHFWYDAKNPKSFGSYKLLFADVVNGSPQAIWRGVSAVGGVLSGSRGGANIDDVDAVKARVGTYYRKFSKLFKDDSIKPPWESKMSIDDDCQECQQINFTAKTAAADFTTIDLAAMGTAFEAVLLVEGVPTSDGRVIEHNATVWRDPPLSLMSQTVTESGHDGAVLAGRIDRIWRQDQYTIMCSGMLDTGDMGMETARLIQDGMLTGISIDGGAQPGDVSYDENSGMISFNRIEILGATVTPMQAHGDAKIRVASAGDETDSRLANVERMVEVMFNAHTREEMSRLEEMFVEVTE